jgi:hypothetical protein
MLIACSACHRQYDVGALEPDDDLKEGFAPFDEGRFQRRKSLQ